MSVGIQLVLLQEQYSSLQGALQLCKVDLQLLLLPALGLQLLHQAGVPAAEIHLVDFVDRDLPCQLSDVSLSSHQAQQR